METKTWPEFMSLRDFLLLKDPFDREPKRSAFRYGDQIAWRRFAPFESAVLHYDIAKESWDKFGPEGPPVGTKVQTLISGHCGGSGALRTFAGVFERDPRFFVLEREGGTSIVERDIWFIHFRAYVRDDAIDKMIW